MSKNILNGSLRLIWDWVGHFFSTLKSSGELLKSIHAQSPTPSSYTPDHPIQVQQVCSEKALKVILDGLLDPPSSLF